MRSQLTSVLLASWFCCVLLVSSRAAAWIFSEHRDGAAQGEKYLSPEDRKTLEELWNEARVGHEARLCKGLGVAPADEDGNVKCISLAVLPAAAGDHSCTPDELWHDATEEDWLLAVVGIANRVSKAMSESPNLEDQINHWNRSNLALENVDENYLTRATVNNAHFVPDRSQGESPQAYLHKALKPGAPLNATAVYVTYHVAAVEFAHEYARTRPQDEERRSRLARAMLVSEAFALHFLEDAFSAGHVIGAWGGNAQAKGTHDYYSVYGFPVTTWKGDEYPAHGDAFMTKEDLKRVGGAVSASLSQVIGVARGSSLADDALEPISPERARKLYALNACTAPKVIETIKHETTLRMVARPLSYTIRASPGEDEVHAPRFRAEIGPFIGAGAGIDGSASFGGFDTESAAPRGSATSIIYAGIGYGLEGVIGRASDGLMELDFGISFSTPQFDASCENCRDERNRAGVVARVPGRDGWLFRYRAPYWVVPGDLLLAGIFVLPFSFQTYLQMAVVAANGGALGLQNHILTPAGALQFMLGRELLVTFYNEEDNFFRFNGGSPRDPANYTAINFGGLKLDVPVFAYKPFRSFSDTLTSAVTIQVGGTMDFPRGTTVVTGEEVSLGESYAVYLRVSLENRMYFGPGRLF